jgi:dinuclear metal center YbgI/SA1388 family protein
VVKLDELERSVNAFLGVDRYQDYCPNGIQVEASTEVNTIVTGVTASMALIERAVSLQADALLVHHGYFWKNEAPALRGIKGRRIARLFEAGISLMAWHLPLDMHPDIGNNACLGRLLGVETDGVLGSSQSPAGLTGMLPTAMPAQQLAEHIAAALGRRPLLLEGDGRPVRRLAWCTGAAQDFMQMAIDAGADAYLTGEVSEPQCHMARESGVHFFAAGHHATERYGIQALGEWLSGQFGLVHHFVDIDNPV